MAMRAYALITALAVVGLSQPALSGVAAAQAKAAASKARAPSKADPAAAFASQEAILRWVNGYRTKPEPHLLPAAVKAMSRLGQFREIENAAVYIGFMAGVLSANGKDAEKLVAGMFPMPPDDQVAIVRAIAYSGLPDWKDILRSFIERMPARKVLIERHLDGKMPTLNDLPLDNGSGPVDTLWGFYFGSGRFEPIMRIVSVLAWSKETNNVERLTIGNMAKWTLANNALRDHELLGMLKAALNLEPNETRAILREVIEAAETFETAKIRKDAFAAIDQLKLKGPESLRTYNAWGQAGQTALAFGCMVAGAMGHVEVGLPCIVSGALSTVALKALGPA